jgi:hypothetical protein
MNAASDVVWTIAAFDEHPALHLFALASLTLLAVGLILARLALKARHRTGVRSRQIAATRPLPTYAAGSHPVSPATVPGGWFPFADDTDVMTRVGAR